MISNKDLILCKEQIFSYSAAYQVPFCGRDKSISEMQRLTKNLQSGEVLVISEPLGTGKTFLVNYLINSGKVNVPVGSAFLTVKRIAEDPNLLERFSGKTLIVDEGDIKTPIEKLCQGLQELGRFLEKSECNAILLGDYSLKNQNISGCLEHKVPLLDFETIDREFLKEVLEKRFEHFFEELEKEFEIEEVIEGELLDYLTPEWMKSVNSFRGIFSLLQQVVSDEKCIRFNGNRAYVTVDMVRSYLDSERNRRMSKNQKKFLMCLQEYLRETYPKGRGITLGFSVEELYELAINNDISIDIEEFSVDILQIFAKNDLLVSTGIPIYERDRNKFVRRPAPYVPSLKLLLSICD